jgi:hypothetical protein
MAGEITISLHDGRCLTFDEVMVIEHDKGEWLRCVRNDPSRRQQFPETTKYYHLARDVDRIVVAPQDSPNGVPPRRLVLRSMGEDSQCRLGRVDDRTGRCTPE